MPGPKCIKKLSNGERCPHEAVEGTNYCEEHLRDINQVIQRFLRHSDSDESLRQSADAAPEDSGPEFPA